MRSILGLTFIAATLLCRAQSQKVTYTYDNAGRLAKADYGNGQTITYVYDNAGNLLSSTTTPAAASAKKTATARGDKSKNGSKEPSRGREK